MLSLLNIQYCLSLLKGRLNYSIPYVTTLFSDVLCLWPDVIDTSWLAQDMIIKSG